MGIAYRCDHALGATVTVWDGRVTVDDWRTLVAAQDADAEWPTGPALLTVAWTVGDFSDFDREAIDAMIETYKVRGTRLRNPKAAIVTAFDLAGATAVPEALPPGTVRAITFGDLRAACAWLAVPLDAVQRIIDELRQEIADRDERSDRVN